MRSTGLHYGWNERLPEERVITYETHGAVQTNPATSLNSHPHGIRRAPRWPCPCGIDLGAGREQIREFGLLSRPSERFRRPALEKGLVKCNLFDGEEHSYRMGRFARPPEEEINIHEFQPLVKARSLGKGVN